MALITLTGDCQNEKKSVAVTYKPSVNELDSETCQTLISDEEWLKALGKDNETLPDYKFELYNRICESFDKYMKANKGKKMAFATEPTSTEGDTTFINIFVELKKNEPSSLPPPPPLEGNEKVENFLRTTAFNQPEELPKPVSPIYNFKPPYLSSPVFNAGGNEYQPQNPPFTNMPLAPINLGVPHESKELREALWDNYDENWQNGLKFPLYEQICEVYELYKRMKPSTPSDQMVEKADTNQHENENISSSRTINILKLLRGETTNKESRCNLQRSN